MRTKFHDCFIVLAFLAGVHSACAQVTNVGIALTGGQSVLFWQPSATNYVLQSTTNLVSPNWVAANDAIPVTALIVSNTSPQRFFRLAAGVPPAGMAFIPAGPFTMGDAVDGNPNGDAAQIAVTVSAFYMDVNLVSWSVWTNVYAYATNHGYSFVNAGKARATNQMTQPVQTVDWYDCVKWSNARSQQAGLAPVYFTDAGLTQVYTNGETDAVYVNWAGNGYRLPTEAEWEKAARGGLIGQRFPWGMTIDDYQANYFGSRNGTGPPAFGYDYAPQGINRFAYDDASEPFTTPVGYFPPNGYGLYDMAGNLEEWCWDWYGYTYAGGTDPHGPSSGVEGTRTARGGDWDDRANYGVAVADRDGDTGPPSDGTNLNGFRCVRGF